MQFFFKLFFSSVQFVMKDFYFVSYSSDSEYCVCIFTV